MGITPIVLPDGTPTCPTGYAYDSVSGLCFPGPAHLQTTVTDPNSGQTWTINDLSSAQVDPKVAAQAAGLGWANDGLIERFVTAFLHGVILLIQPLLSLWISVQDSFFAAIANLLTVAQGEGKTGFYQLSASLVSDLFGIEIDGNALAQQYTSGGRLAAVSALGQSIINILAAEFTGVYQSSGATGYSVPPGQGIGGLPATPLDPAQGVKAMAAFLGFGTEFGVREGNAELIAKSIPYGLGEGVRDMAVTVARGVNLGRLGRVAMMPLFKTLVATPAQWALNKQYTPTLLDPNQAKAADLLAGPGNFDLVEEMARHGYSADRIKYLTAMATRTPSFAELNTLVAAGEADDNLIATYLARERWDTDGLARVRTASDLAPARHICLAVATKYVTDFVEGKANLSDVQQLLASLPYLTPGEVSAYNALISATEPLAAKGPLVKPKHLGIGEYEKAFLDGLITLDELTTAINAHYSDPVEQEIALLLTLFRVGQTAVAQASLIKRAAKLGISLPGPLPKL